MTPRHVGVILDDGANRAGTDGPPEAEAYRRSCLKQLEIVEWCRAEGVSEVTLYIPPPTSPLADEELEAVWGEVLDQLRQDRAGIAPVTLHHLGDPALLPAALAARLPGRTGPDSRNGHGFTVNLVLGYEGRNEIRDAVSSILVAAQDESRSLAEAISGLDAEQLGAHLLTGTLPPIDLVIRTAGRRHLAGFLPWQAAYAEFHFTTASASEFARGDLTVALADYSRRNRRFGK
ncbi:undecaprenyl diphosphate synthase family protein [Streptomyces sp. CB01881]|uniref:undecaprenyl diphosphate synthase family protein n=1 Tax=Streptomyces sp. CB01881 TaxID=2078691 RepID=UPI000CDC7DE0|nr:undecaprenyl diphosphate synthase family protein [Streptomyces sp. CB01881]AUY52534.1 UDP pyrophosphate synthase [Streptomyces sp. CB01881]TYC70251.1 UDP pyrophosphate synthase [Streptomyces sp. CB01881]